MIACPRFIIFTALAACIVAINVLAVHWEISDRFFFSADAANLCVHSVLV
jgi:hypothetical protein